MEGNFKEESSRNWESSIVSEIYGACQFLSQIAELCLVVVPCYMLLLFCCLTLWPHELQHARLPCPSLSPWVCWNSCLLSQWCRPVLSSSVYPFSSCRQSFPASGSFPVSQLFTSGGQSIGASWEEGKCSFPPGLIVTRLLVVRMKWRGPIRWAARQGQCTGQWHPDLMYWLLRIWVEWGKAINIFTPRQCLDLNKSFWCKYKIHVIRLLLCALCFIRSG